MLKPTIGLEIHAELKTRTKMFCGCLNDASEKHPNINICPVCAGHPGSLPTINREAVKAVLKLGLALEAKVAETAKFDRKNYFYPDLPKGYQISQYDRPLVESGVLVVEYKNKDGDWANKAVRLSPRSSGRRHRPAYSRRKRAAPVWLILIARACR